MEASLELMPTASNNQAAANEPWPEVQAPPPVVCPMQAPPDGRRPPLTAAELEAAHRSWLRFRERACACVALFARVCLRSTAAPRPPPLQDEWHLDGRGIQSMGELEVASS